MLLKKLTARNLMRTLRYLRWVLLSSSIWPKNHLIKQSLVTRWSNGKLTFDRYGATSNSHLLVDVYLFVFFIRTVTYAVPRVIKPCFLDGAMVKKIMVELFTLGDEDIEERYSWTYASISKEFWIWVPELLFFLGVIDDTEKRDIADTLYRKKQLLVSEFLLTLRENGTGEKIRDEIEDFFAYLKE